MLKSTIDKEDFGTSTCCANVFASKANLTSTTRKFGWKRGSGFIIKRIVMGAIAVLCISGNAWGQTTLASWNFPNNPDDAVCDGGIAANSTKTISLVNADATINFAQAGNGTRCASSTDWTNGANVKCFVFNDISTTGYSSITFTAEMRGNNNASPRDFKAQYRVNNGTWTDVGSAISLTTTWTSVVTNLLLPTASNQGDVDIRIIQTTNTSIGSGTINTNRRAEIDNVEIRGIPPGLSVTPTNLDFGFVTNGGTSSNMTYALSGNSLSPASGNITVIAPTNFEVSLNAASGYSSSISIPYTGGSISSTTIYAHFSPTSSNTTYSGDITNSGGGSATQSVAVAGNSIVTYCSSSGNTTYQTSITLVNFNTISNASAKPSGYSDYTALSTDVIVGNSYNLTVNLNTDGNYRIYATAWIDWNQNGDFTDAGETYNLGTTLNSANGQTSLSPLSITIPAGAISGNTRMRVSAKYNASSTSCETGFDGEVEDYSLNIMQPATVYYSQSSNPTQLSSWNTVRTGGGSSPTSFTANNQTFVIQATHSMTAASAWSISGSNTKLQVEGGASLTANAAITLSASTAFQLDNGATYNHNVASNTVWGGTEQIDPNSTVVYGYAGAQNVAALSYGNLTVNGGGTKSLQGNASVNGNLNLANGNLSLGSGAYSLTLTSGATISGSFDNGHMVVCDGTGSLVKQGTSEANFVMVYPVGTGSVYTPYEVTSLTATVSGTGSISVRAVPAVAPGPPSANSTDLKKYWDVFTSGLSSINANLTLTYDSATETGLGGDQTKYIPYYYSSATSTWSIPVVASGAGVNPMTVSGATSLTGQWTAREEPVYTTYYSYQSGPWNTATTWTTDPSGTLSVNPAVPGINDRVVILNGRTVTTTANGYEVLSVQINEGGTLNLGTFTNQIFTAIRGQGLVRLQNTTFPTGDWSNFVSAGGGTVEYYNTSSFTFSQLVYNNLIINLSSNALVATLTGDMTINGNLTVTEGKYQINNNSNTSRTVSILGNVYVSPNGSIGIGTGNANHRIIVNGDFTNDGVVRFTNQVTPSYTSTPNNGRSDVVFNNATADQTLQCNGQSDFCRIEIDKGFDQTYVLNIDASDNTKFKLFGENDFQSSPPTNAPPSIENANALGLLAGTVRLGPNIVLPSLADNAVYNVDLDAQLWLDGATVTFSSIASNSSIVIYGKLRVSNGATFNANGGQGIVMRDQSALMVESGTITTSCIRTSYISGIHRGAFTQSGGTINITGNSLNLIGLSIYASFTLPYPDNVFRMSGGTINISSPTTVNGGPGTSFSMLLGSNPNNVSVTGGTINITVPTNRNAYINTTVPLWNINFTSTSNTYKGQIQNYAGNTTPYIPVISAQPLIVYNDLNVQNSAVFNANGSDVTIGHNFTINTTAEYETANNTTTFNGSGGQRFTNAGIVNNNTGLYNLTIAGTSNTDIFSNNLTVRGNLDIEPDCFLNDVGHTISVAGNITNSGTHTSQAGGAILLNGGSLQTIGGSGNGLFGNLNLNNASGASLTANQSIAGNLRLATGILNIGTFNLSLGTACNVYDALTGTTANFTGTKMIRVAGNQSDGGVTKAYSTTTSFLFPIGTASDYTPATLQFTIAPTTWGSVTVRPVAQIQPFATSTNALDYYWKVTSDGFTGVQAGSVSHSYKYVDADLVGHGTEANYIPSAYRPYSWVPINDISKVVDASNTILFNNIDFIDGDYTAGEISAFQAVKVFYSRQSGDWNDPNTWSSVSVGGAVDGAIPGADNPVVIGDTANNHTVTVPIGYNNITVGGLQINTGSILDLQTTTGHNFGAIPDTKILGTGTLKISSSTATATFPGGDFGNFLSKGGGTVEYNSTPTLGAATFTLPTTYTSGASTINIIGYNNLVTSPESGKSITLPNTNLAIYDNFTVTGNGVSQLNNAATSRVVTIDSNLVVQSGTLRYTNGNNTAQSMVVNGDISVEASATFDVNTTGNATNSLTLYGNLTNNGTFDMNTGASQVCNVTFTGNTNKEINGSGSTTNFNTIVVDKGNSRNTLLEVKSAALSLNTNLATALTLTNGTFRLTSPITLNLTNSGSFNIPVSGSLSANGGTINIGGPLATDATDLQLDGRLEVIAGGINIGSPGTAFNNDIEYSSAGYPEIIVSGGSLYVNGQIRRVTTINTGSLNYTQSNDASVVTIAGQNANNSRAMLEILNTGSKFNMSGGTLNITGSFNSSSYNDLYLAPDSSTVTGGTILFGSTVTPANTNFNAVTSVPLYNLEVDATTNNKTVDLRIYPLTLKNNLTINGNSVFKANGLNVTIGGNLTNENANATTGLNTGGYQPGSSSQVTTFNGAGTKNITGSGANLTNFACLTINSTGTVLLNPNSNIKVNSNLALNKGILDDGGNSITLVGNVDNNATHTSSIAGGGLYFEGSQPQVISGSGTGVFGNVTLNNTTGINMVDNSVVNGALTFTYGSLYIDDYLLTLGANATIGGTPDVTKMIILNGVISDEGVKKIFPSGASTFTYPIGVAGKYTPVTYNFGTNSNSNAYIVVKPVNYAHPALANPVGDELDYYWNVISSGFGAATYTVDHTYSYLGSDVTGDETTYVTGRFLGGVWDPLGGIDESSVNYTTHKIHLAAKDFIDGEYTAGTTTNFTPNLPILYSTKSGSWYDDTVWSTVSSSGPSCGCHPVGNPVVIAAAHTIAIDADGADAYSVELDGTLDVGQTVFHNIGHVTGGGKLNITSTSDGFFVFPGGNYDVFMATSGSTIEFMGSNDASLPLKPGNNYKPYQNVIFSGTGKKLISAEDLKVLKDLTIKDASTVLSNEQFNRTVTILGNWIDNNTSAIGGFIPGRGMVYFNGTANQNMNISSGAATEQFYNLTINNSAGVTITGSGKANVSNLLYLTSGNITTSNTNLLSISNTSSNAVYGGGSGSFVNGPLQKKMLSGGSFSFPVGDVNGARFGKLTISEVSISGNYIAQYFNHNPLIDGYDPTIKTPPVDVVSNIEYWRVNGPTSANANVTVRWDSNSGIIPVDAATREKLRIVEWNSSWVNRGDIVTDGGVSSGTIKTSPSVNIPGDHYFTIGVESLPTATITSGDASICNDGSSTAIDISLTGTGPWTIKYKINGANETTISNIATSPYSLVVSNAIPALASGGPGTYAFSISYVKDATGSTGISDFTTTATITLNTSPTPAISGLSTTPANSTVTYSTPNVSGVTYLWSVSGGTIQNGQGTYQIQVLWGAGPAGTVTLSETATVGGCSKTTPAYNVTITDIPNPVVSGNDVVCAGAGYETYSTPLVGTHTYVWTVVGGTIVSGQNTNSISVDWTIAGAGSVKVTETGSTSVSNTLPVTVNPLPPSSNVVSDPSVCEGDVANIVVTGAPAGITYQLRLNSDDTPVGSPVSSGPGGDVTLPVTPATSSVYNVWATNEYSCGVELTDLANVTVNPKPTASWLSGNTTTCAGNTGDGFSVTNVAGCTYAWAIEDNVGTIVGAGNSITVNWNSNSAIFTGLVTSVIKKVTVTITNAGGCSTILEQSVTIHRVPESGPTYHISDSFGY